MPDKSKNTEPAPEADPPGQTSGPSTPKPNPQVRVEPAALLVEDTDPRVGDDGQVYVSQAISDAAVAEGYAPDDQPKSHDATSVGVVPEDA